MSRISRLLAALVAISVAVGAISPARAQDGVASISAESITTAQRLTLEVSFTVAPGWTLEPWAESARSSFEASGWTVTEMIRSPVTLHGTIEGALEHTARFTLEPFLPGAYTVPAIAAKATSPGAPAIELSTDPQAVEVLSVLAEDEPIPQLVVNEADAESQGALFGSDLPLGAFRDPPREPTPGAPLLLFLASGVSLLGAGVASFIAFRAARSGRPAGGIDPIRALIAIQKQAAPDLAAIDRHLRALERAHTERDGLDEAARAEIATLLGELERIRYRPVEHDNAIDAPAFAARAGEIAHRVRENERRDAS